MKQSTIAAIVLSAGLAGTSLAQPTGFWKMTWSDEFDGTSLDTTKWTPQDVAWPYNAELEYYSPDQVSVANGMLTITSLRRVIGGRQYSSGRIESGGHFAQTYGRFEYRAKLPTTQGLWPAFWLLPASNGWPPEIDIMEMLGNQPSKIYGTHHWGTAQALQSYGGSYVGPDYSQDFHIFAVEWFPDRIDWYVDGVKYFSDNANIPQEPMFFIINTAVGGQWPGNPDGTTVFPQYHIVDYVRAYQWQTDNGLTNGNFEQANMGANTFTGWGKFGNAYVQNIQPRSGLYAAKAFGQFNGVANNESGWYQDRTVNAGDHVVASVYALDRSADKMTTGNSAVLRIEWYNASSALISSTQVTALLPTDPTDVYIQSQIAADAPAGTVRARMVLSHVQAANGGGAVQFDDATFTSNTSLCYANCDGSTTAPALTASDFTCFLSAFRAGNMYANCDGSTGSPVFTANDFTCFLNAFRTGCP
jgi:beta-glucanase (GH16 family)